MSFSFYSTPKFQSWEVFKTLEAWSWRKLRLKGKEVLEQGVKQWENGGRLRERTQRRGKNYYIFKIVFILGSVFWTDQRSSVRNQMVEIKYDGGVYFLIQHGRDRMEKVVLDFAFGRFTLGLVYWHIVLVCGLGGCFCPIYVYLHIIRVFFPF